MVRREFVVVSVLLACALNVAQCSSENGKTRMKVISISNMTQFLSENPGVQLTPLASKIVNTTPYIQRVYPFGARVLGDRILATDHAQQQWGTPQDVTKNLYYPAQGIGAVITYLEIIVDQSSYMGQAYLVSGGIGHRFISVVIEARSTFYFSYRAAIYGY